MQGEDGRETAHEGTDREQVSPAAKDRGGGPGEDDREPDHERGRVHAKLGEAVLALVEPHPLQRRDHDDSQEDEERTGQHPEEHVVASSLAAPKPVSEQEERQNEGCDGHELEEAVPRVLRVAEARTPFDERAAAEQVADLNEDEREEEQVQAAEHDGDLGASERERRANVRFERLPSHEVLAQEAGCDPGEHDDERDVREDFLPVRHGIGHEALEDLVGGDEEGPEDEEERRCK